MQQFDWLDKKRRFKVDGNFVDIIEKLTEPYGLYVAITQKRGPTLTIQMLYAGLKWEEQNNAKFNLSYVKKCFWKAIKSKRITMIEAENWVYDQVLDSDLFSGMTDDDENEEGDEENPTAATSDGDAS